MGAIHLGRNAKLYYGAIDDELSELSVAASVADVTVNVADSDIDATTRGDEAYAVTEDGHNEISVDCEVQFDKDDEFYAALELAYINKTKLQIAALSGVYNAAGTRGPRGVFRVAKLNHKQPLKDKISVEVTLKLSVWTEWIMVGVS